MTAEQSCKVCIYCKRSLPLDRFRVRSDRPHMPLSYCRECDLVKCRERYEAKVRTGWRKKTGRKTWVTTDKTRARAKLNGAIRSGAITPMPCTICGEKAHGHHHDYSKPYDVEWLCVKHHGYLHRKALSVNAQAIRQREGA